PGSSPSRECHADRSASRSNAAGGSRCFSVSGPRRNGGAASRLRVQTFRFCRQAAGLRLSTSGLHLSAGQSCHPSAATERSAEAREGIHGPRGGEVVEPSVTRDRREAGSLSLEHAGLRQAAVVEVLASQSGRPAARRSACRSTGGTLWEADCPRKALFKADAGSPSTTPPLRSSSRLHAARRFPKRSPSSPTRSRGLAGGPA